MALRSLIWVWVALLLLLAATVGASFLPIGQWRQLINLMIAFAKAALILWFFMKLRDEKMLVRLMAAMAGVLLLIMAIMLTADYHFRS